MIYELRGEISLRIEESGRSAVRKKERKRKVEAVARHLYRD
jgi:hypothetical protein